MSEQHLITRLSEDVVSRSVKIVSFGLDEQPDRRVIWAVLDRPTLKGQGGHRATYECRAEVPEDVVPLNEPAEPPSMYPLARRGLR